LAALGESTMNRNQVMDTAKNVAGKIQQQLGEVTNHKFQQAKGAARYARGGLWKKTRTLEQELDKLDKK
jgi:uncharacterized protein YjbJ (UPF0337 family)